MSSGTQYEAMVSNADLSEYQYHFMVNSGTRRVDRADTAGESVTGVLQDKPAAADRSAGVAVQGRSKMKAGGTIVGGADITVTASATAVTATSGDYIVGKALTGVESGGIFDGTITHTGYKG